MAEEIRLLIIDDSTYNRRAIADFFKGFADVKIVGKAIDGQEGLQLALNESPSVITLDLEMPRIDGFAFLRLLMASQPTPVIVISSHSNQENVFRALELGALDFVAKPSTLISPEIKALKAQVVQKVRAAGKYNPHALKDLSSCAPVTGMHFIPKIGKDDEPLTGESRHAKKIVAIGASTGGPATLTKIISALPEHLEAGIVISQHMPPIFTSTFAKRLNKLSNVTVVEVQKKEIVKKGHVYVAPGDGDLLLSRIGNAIKVHKARSLPESKYRPSVDRMFESAAEVAHDDVLGIVLTGMGDDGAAGCRKIYDNGGSILVESEDTAVVYGMPAAVLEAHVPAKSRPLQLIAGKIVSFARGKTL